MPCGKGFETRYVFAKQVPITYLPPTCRLITGRHKRNAVLAYEKCRFTRRETAFLYLLCCFGLLSMLFTMPKYAIYRH